MKTNEDLVMDQQLVDTASFILSRVVGRTHWQLTIPVDGWLYDYSNQISPKAYQRWEDDGGLCK